MLVAPSPFSPPKMCPKLRHWFYGHLKPMIPPLSSRGSPLYIYDVSRTLFHTHCICYIFWLTPPPKKTLTNPHTISLYVCISLTQPHVGGVRTQEENRCTGFSKKRIGAPCTYSRFVPSHTQAGTQWSSFLYEMAAHVLIWTSVAVVYLGRSCTTRARNKVRLDALPRYF